MAGMFYSLEEVMTHLGKTEEQVKELVAQQKLKEFRDGDKVLYKADQVQQLAEQGDAAEEPVELVADQSEDVTGDAEEELITLEPADDTAGGSANLEFEETSVPAADDEEPVKLNTDDDDLDIDLDNLNLDAASSEGSSIELLLDETTPISDDPDAAIDESIGANISGIGADVDLAELSKADTNIGTTGINVLADTDDEYKLTSDTKSETVAADEEGTGLGDLDDDINMDSIGSGSGLLDLSLQADDTSLGAVLDDILPAAGDVAEAPLTAEESHMAEEADKIFEEAGEDSAVTAAASEPKMVARYVEPEPDAMSNACGIMLLVPLVALIYAVIIVLMGLKGISPAIMKFSAGDGPMGMAMIWTIVIGLSVVSLLIIGVSALSGRKAKKAENQEVYQQPEE
ncbi:MAG: helix-turn-helix domain-containing protein [Sedimentisphaerales bacterium]|nr:helix-turn-helix domain-containing protein [Sedimentisphaerales bacterium]